MSYINDNNHDIRKDSQESILVGERLQVLQRSINYLEQVIAPQVEASPVNHVEHTITGQFDHLDIYPEPTPAIVEQPKLTRSVIAEIPPVSDVAAISELAKANANTASFAELLIAAQEAEKHHAA